MRSRSAGTITIRSHCRRSATLRINISNQMCHSLGRDRTHVEGADPLHECVKFSGQFQPALAGFVEVAEPIGQGLTQQRPQGLVTRPFESGALQISERGLGGIRWMVRLQSGVVSDYVTWMVLGVACLGGALTLSIR